MKKLRIVLSVVILFMAWACNTSQTKFNTEEEITKIETLLDQYVIANEKQDIGIIETIWSDAKDIELIGTENDELLVGWDVIKKAISDQFNLFDNTYISVNDQIIHLNETGNTAWFFETLNYNFIYVGKAMSFEGIRFTGVVEKKNGNWEIVQGHLSVPASLDIDTE
jgi:SnoaL-like protein